MTKQLGRLITVPVRGVWPHEAIDFTPWLAEAENLALLADAVGLSELRVQGTEVPVGSFYIDILAKDIDGKIVLIENQFGPTDHTHLGQIMTYIAGQEGNGTIIWIAEKFREEHRAAIDWLNAATVEGFDFFAIEVEALRIGDSLPAPWFNVVGKPNAWSRNVSRTTRAASDRPPDERQKEFIAYWSAFSDFIQSRQVPFKVRVPVPRDNWYTFGLGRSWFSLAAVVGFRDRKVGVRIDIGGTTAKQAKQAFDLLEGDRVAIEADFGGSLDWQRLNDKKWCRIAVSRSDFDPTNKQQWPEQHEWLLDQLSRFARAFTDRIKRLQLDADAPEPEIGG